MQTIFIDLSLALSSALSFFCPAVLAESELIDCCIWAAQNMKSQNVCHHARFKHVQTVPRQPGKWSSLSLIFHLDLSFIWPCCSLFSAGWLFADNWDAEKMKCCILRVFNAGLLNPNSFHKALDDHAEKYLAGGISHVTFHLNCSEDQWTAPGETCDSEWRLLVQPRRISSGLKTRPSFTNTRNWTK